MARAKQPPATQPLATTSRRTVMLGALLGGAAALALPRPALAYCEIFPRDSERLFQVLRHGQVVGEYRYRFQRRAADFVVQVDAYYALGPAAAPLYRFEHHSEEVWRDGWLQTVVSDTDRNGQLWRLRMERVDKSIKGLVNGHALTVSGYLIPTSLWHHDTPAEDVLFSIVDGFPKVISSAQLGEREVGFQGERVVAQGYRVRGQLVRDLWYDERCRLVRVAFPAFDGSEVIMEAP